MLTLTTIPIIGFENRTPAIHANIGSRIQSKHNLNFTTLGLKAGAFHHLQGGCGFGRAGNVVYVVGLAAGL